MTVQATLQCPHCKTGNTPGAAFCASCGKALPIAGSGPKIVSADALPASAAGAKLVGDELVKQTKSAANALLAVGIIQIVLGGVLIAVAQSNHVASTRLSILIATVVVIGGIFIALYFWARKSPLPATIVGLVVYGTLLAINVVQSINAMAQNNGRGGTGFGGIGIGWLDILIIVLLVRGIGAAQKHRKLLLSQSAL